MRIIIMGAGFAGMSAVLSAAWIHPPKAERAAALASADPEQVTEV